MAPESPRTWTSALEKHEGHEEKTRRTRRQDTKDTKKESKGPARHPLAIERVADHVARALLHDDVLAHERGERGLHAGRAGQAMTGADLGRQQLAAVLEDDGTQHRAL